MPDPAPILALSDGKPGHYSATAGIVEAVQRLTAAPVERIEIRLRAKLLRPILAANLAGIARTPERLRAQAARHLLRLGYRAEQDWPERVTAIVSTGGDTLYANALLAYISGAPNLFCGSLRGVNPRHFARIVTNRSADNPSAIPNAVILETAPMPTRPRAPRSADAPFTVALLVGGDGSGYVWKDDDWQALAARLVEIDRVAERLLVTTSRRTPTAAEDRLAEAAGHCRNIARSVWFNRSPEKVMAEFLSVADAFVVTADSATMLTEAVLTGRPVLIAGPRPSAPRPRYQRFLDQLVRDRRARQLLPDQPFPDRAALVDSFVPIDRHPVDQLADALAPLFAGGARR